MSIYYNPLDKKCKSIIGAVEEGQEFTIRVFSDDFLCGKIDINEDGKDSKSFLLKKTEYGFTITLKINSKGLYFYRFIFDDKYFGISEKNADYLEENGLGFELTIYKKGFTTPDWIKGGIMYQIFPDRFNKKGDCVLPQGRILRKDWGGIPNYLPNKNGKIENKDFFGGNLKGIEDKLSYLAQLGVSIIYLNPIFESASNHRYDTSDYMQIDPLLGTKEDFKQLVLKAKELGISIILDGVFNHTGADSIYFNKYGHYQSIGAYQSKESPYYDWYNFRNFPDDYESWWGIDILPAINETSKTYQEYLFNQKNGVLNYWLNYGIGGFRLDVADELPDEFLQKLRKTVKENNKQSIVIGEVWEDAANKISYSTRRKYLQGEELDSVMNYPLKDAIISYLKTENSIYLSKTMKKLQDHYPKQVLDCLMNILDTHDTKRILTALSGIEFSEKNDMAIAKLKESEKEVCISKLKMALVLQYTLPGIPCVYYGDENAMEGYSDPFCRKCFDWEYSNLDVLEFYKKIGYIRKKFNEFFKTGEYKEIYQKNGLIFYKRILYKNNVSSSIYIYMNNSANEYKCYSQNKYVNLINDSKFMNIISPYSYGILINEED